MEVEGIGTISGVNIIDLVLDPQDNQAIYLASAGSGLFYTWDAAKTWKQVKGLPTGFINSVAVDHKDKCNLFVALQNRLWKSTDCARSWKNHYYDTRAGVFVNSLAIDLYSGKILYAGLSNGDLLKSLDAGVSWSTIKRFDNKIQKIVIHPTNTNIVFVALESEGLWKSNNKGGSWKDLREKMKDFGDSGTAYDLDMTADAKTIYFTSQYGVLVSAAPQTVLQPL